ncbi:MAG: hypothetical protein WC656_08040 [Sulfurimonas sp.]|jgi:hypothetical protein
MQHDEIQERIRQIKEAVVDNSSSALVPKPILHTTILFSAFLSLLNFGVTPELFMLKKLELGFAIAIMISVLVGTSYAFYIFVLKNIVRENSRLNRPYGKNQRFVGEIYLLVTMVGIVMSGTVFIFGTFATVYLYWMTLIGIALFVLGHFTHKAIKTYGRFLLFIGLTSIVIVASYFGVNGIDYTHRTLESEKFVSDIGRIIAVIFSGFGQLVLWRYLKKYDV